MKLQLRLILVFVSLLYVICPGTLSAQLSQGGVPVSFSVAMPVDTINMISLAPPATDQLALEDKDNPVPYRFAVNIAVDLGIDATGHWSTAPDGTGVWRITIRAAGARALTLYFDHFRMPEGARLFAYNPGRTRMIGAFTEANNNSAGTFATELIHGEQLTLEYDAPAGTGAPELHINEVAYAYRGIADYSGLKTGFGTAGKCEVNVHCAEGATWQNQVRSVVRVQVKRGTQNVWCTGSMINNTLNNGKPYLITADHCGNQSTATDLTQWIFYFNYEGTACANPTVEPALKSLTGATMVAHGGNSGLTGSDFFLVLLQSLVPKSYNVYYNGWNRDVTTPSPSGVGIHHPSGDIKKISTYTAQLQPSNWNGGAFLSHWQVNWIGTADGHGTTEGGSSGSPLFDNMGRLVGTLTGGQSSCDSSALNSPDYYGQFAYDWDKNGTDSTKVLKYWLDPLNTNVMAMNGWALSVEEPAKQDWISLYPNPVSDILYMSTGGIPSGSLRVMITGVYGNQVLNRELKRAADVYQVDLSGLPVGLYVVQVSDGVRRIVRKIIKQ